MTQSIVGQTLGERAAAAGIELRRYMGEYRFFRIDGNELDFLTDDRVEAIIYLAQLEPIPADPLAVRVAW